MAKNFLIILICCFVLLSPRPGYSQFSPNENEIKLWTYKVVSQSLYVYYLDWEENLNHVVNDYDNDGWKEFKDFLLNENNQFALKAARSECAQTAFPKNFKIKNQGEEDGEAFWIVNVDVSLHSFGCNEVVEELDLELKIIRKNMSYENIKDLKKLLIVSWHVVEDKNTRSAQ